MENTEKTIPSKGMYFLDNYNLDNDDTFTYVKAIYRVDEIETDNTRDEYASILCTKMSICYDERKKTGKKILIEGKISDFKTPIKNGIRNTFFTKMKTVGKDEWDSIAKELLSLIIENSKTNIDL